MTLILNCLTPNFVLQVSDRRLTYPNGSVADENENKATFVNGNMVFSYTGLAYIGGKTKTSDWFLAVLLEAHKMLGDVSLTRTAEFVAKRAKEAIEQLPYSQSQKRTAFAGVGWGRIPGKDDLNPIYIVISNAHDEKGKWLRTANDEFRVFPFIRSSEQKMLFAVDGQQLPNELEKYIKRLLKKCVSHNVSPRAMARILIELARRVAAKNQLVGNDLLVSSIPKSAVNSNKFLARGVPPIESDMSFLFVPKQSFTPTQYSPNVFFNGIILKDLSWKSQNY